MASEETLELGDGLSASSISDILIPQSLFFWKNYSRKNKQDDWTKISKLSAERLSSVTLGTAV